MKKFRFSLDNVLAFKEQELEECKRLHGLAAAAVAHKEGEINALEDRFAAEKDAFNQKKRQGITIIEAQSTDAHLRRLHKSIEREYVALAALREQEEASRESMVLKKQEVSSIEKLREKRLGEYNQAAQKEEEGFIEEIVLNRRVAAG